MNKILWEPSQGRKEKSQMTRFTDWLQNRTGEVFSNYGELHRWSIEHLEEFWEAYLEYSYTLYDGTFDTVLDRYEMPGAHWFQGMKLNYAENLLLPNPDWPALISTIEGPGNDLQIQEMRFDELRHQVGQCARELRWFGVGKGDVVAGYLANVPEAVIAALACASLGACWCSASPDFGLEAVVSRFERVRPKILFASTHYSYGGIIYQTTAVVRELKQWLPSVEKIISVPYPVGEPTLTGDLFWDEFMGPDEAIEPEYVFVEFDDPLFILFSSGTTGKPKGLVHGCGGTLIQHKKELQLHCDLFPGDRLLYFTTLGWMMWNWQLSALSLGASVCLYDGNPAYPDITALWRVVDRLKVTHLGTSGRYLESCMKQSPPLSPAQLGDLNSLKVLLYTGSPLSEDGYRWVYKTVKQDLQLSGISGGTDIVSCFVLGNPNLPVHAGEIQCRGLGVDAAVFDPKGQELEAGEPGELVCRKPLPSMPVAFLDDPKMDVYRATYFEQFPGVWCHGDYVEFTENGGIIIYGRSDATMNPGGVRIGSAEIYSALDSLPEIVDSLVVGWRPPDQIDEQIVLSVVLGQSKTLDSELTKRIRETIRRKCSPRHTPHHIFQVSDVPTTRSGKPGELTVKAILAGRSVSNQQALANPEVLFEFEEIRKQLDEIRDQS